LKKIQMRKRKLRTWPKEQLLPSSRSEKMQRRERRRQRRKKYLIMRRKRLHKSLKKKPKNPNMMLKLKRRKLS
jgi:hypothetical protein